MSVVGSRETGAKVLFRRAVEHDCRVDGLVVTHTRAVDVTWHNPGAEASHYYRGVRCDGSGIEWVEPR